MEEKKVIPISGEWAEYRQLVLYQLQCLHDFSRRVEDGVDGVRDQVCENTNKLDNFIEGEKQESIRQDLRIAKVETESAENRTNILELKTKIGVWSTIIGIFSSFIFEVARLLFNRF